MKIFLKPTTESHLEHVYRLCVDIIMNFGLNVDF